jgi:hypothetical protein
MKFPKRWPHRVRKSLIPDKTQGKGAVPKKQPRATGTGKPPPSDWRRRWFLSIAAMILTSGAIMMPALAQNAPPGPVHFPDPAVTNAPAATPTNAATAEDIHDICGPMAIPYGWLWAAYIVAGLALAALVYGAWRFFRSRFKTKEKMPFELALDLLDEAYKQVSSEEITVREYAFLASEVIRIYIEQRFGEKAARRTTEEFLSDLLGHKGTPLAQHRRRLEDFLNHCDLIKFARWGASAKDLESMHESARVFILETRPRPEPEKPLTPPVAPAQPELLQAK